MNKYFVFFIIAYLTGAGGLSACSFFKSDAKDVAPTAPIEEATPKNLNPAAAKGSMKNAMVEEWARHLAQADAVYREAWRLAAAQELGVGKSPFGRIYRPLVRDLGVKMSTGQGIPCDRYKIKKTDEKSPKISWEIANDCGSSEQDWLATIQQTASGFELSFSPEELQDVLGVQSSILFRKVSCRFDVVEHILVKMECDRLAKDKSATEVLRFDIFKYQQKMDPLLLLQGKVLVNLADQRKFEFRLPQEGKGLIVETELFPPEEEVTPHPVPVPSAPAAIVAPPQNKGPSVGTDAVGPAQQADQLRRRLPPNGEVLPEGAMGGRRLDPNQEPNTEGNPEDEENNEESSSEEGSNEEGSNEEGGAEEASPGDSNGEVESAPVLDPRNSR